MHFSDHEICQPGAWYIFSIITIICFHYYNHGGNCISTHILTSLTSMHCGSPVLLPRQSQWAAQFVNVVLGHTELVSVLVHRLWDLFHNQVTCHICTHPIVNVRHVFQFQLIVSHVICFVFFFVPLCTKGSSLTASHLLGLAALVVHLHASSGHSPLVQMMPSVAVQPVPLTEALSAALLCNTQDNMLFCVR